jgi:hypothetical protein
MRLSTRSPFGVVVGSVVGSFVLACVGSSFAAGTVFPIKATGGQESPAGDPDGEILGTITLDPATNTLSWNLTFTNIAAPTLMHIHSGQDGSNGPVFVDMGIVTTGGPGTLVNTKVITPTQATSILTNPQNFYLNVHNATFPAGALRAQLPVVFKVSLRGALETTPGDLDGGALGSIWLDTGNNEVGWNLASTNIAAPSLFHIHTGALGVSGGVHIDLGVDTTGGPGTLIDSTAATDALLDAVLANPLGFYLNLHTSEFPAGALRGQVQAAFPAALDGAQEVGAPGDPDGSATGFITFETRLNRVSWNVSYQNIAAPTLFHIHDGDFGTNGPVFVDLGIATTGGPGTLVNATTTTAAKVDAILADPRGFYLNLHNAEFPAGALRGQLELPAPTPVFGDLDGNGTVDAADLAILLGAWGPGSGPADLDGSGTVDAADLALLLGAWG